jgi:two-component system chemotaxis response regulator CheY
MTQVGGKTVLVIDDSSMVRLYYREALAGVGFKVDEALNGLEALEHLLTTPADLLIVDINMPKMDGLSFLRALRRHETPIATIPALVTSTEARDVDVEAAFASGANFYLPKPLTTEMLIACASMLAGQRQ